MEFSHLSVRAAPVLHSGLVISMAMAAQAEVSRTGTQAGIVECHGTGSWSVTTGQKDF